ncbi:MAG: hypothetical protein ACQERH_00920 [Acidobacteriota bacterium]
MKSRARTLFLMAALSVLFVWVGSVLGTRQGAVTAFVLAGLMNFVGHWFSDKLVLRRYRALIKIHQGVQAHTLANGNPAHSHLFIVNPFFGGLQRLFSTHPPVEERIRRLFRRKK